MAKASERRRPDRKSIILDEAETLFREQGYSAVSLGELAQAVGIRKPSIYHHFPAGKEELFVAVQIRMFERTGTELRRLMDEAAPDIRIQLHAAARWFLAQPPMFLLSMIHNDMDELSPEGRKAVGRASYGLIMSPLMETFTACRDRGAARPDLNAHTVAGAFLAVLEANTIAHRAGFGSGDLSGMMEASVNLLLDGALVR